MTPASRPVCGALALLAAALLLATAGCDATVNLDLPLDVVDTGADNAAEGDLTLDPGAADAASEASPDLGPDAEIVPEPAPEAPDASPDATDVEIDASPCETDDPCRVAKLGDGGECEILPLSCASPSACQVARCDPGLGGCVLDPADCDDHDPHTQDWCSPESGCVHLGGACGDGVCNPGEKESCPGDCKPGRPECGDGVCQGPEEAQHCPGDCKDPPAECGDGQCAMPELWMCPEDCPDFVCNDGQCWPGEAFFCSEDCEATAACDDGDACTVDWQEQGGACHHDLISCDDGSDCTVDACLPSTGCIYTDACADDDPCTEGLCWFGHCAVTTLPWCE